MISPSLDSVDSRPRTPSTPRSIDTVGTISYNDSQSTVLLTSQFDEINIMTGIQIGSTIESLDNCEKAPRFPRTSHECTTVEDRLAQFRAVSQPDGEHQDFTDIG